MHGLTQKQQQAIPHLLSAPTLVEAARWAGVNEATLRRWLQQPVFQEAYREARLAALGRATTLLCGASEDAVLTLRELMVCADSPGARVRLSAARTILELAQQGVELDDVQMRINALEDILAAKEA